MTQEEKEWTLAVGKTIIDQIFCCIDINVFFSWGVARKTITSYSGMPSLALYVNGALHKGWVIVSLNAGSDTYEIRLFGPDNETVVKMVKNVFCDNLGAMIDELVERPADITDEQYTELIIQSEGA